MSGITLSRRARSDLLSVWRYSARTWSPRQADSYVRSLHARLAEAASRPTLFRLRPDLGAGVYDLRIRSHVAFVSRADDESWTVIAILHGHMDAAAHLSDEGPES